MYHKIQRRTTYKFIKFDKKRPYFCGLWAFFKKTSVKDPEYPQYSRPEEWNGKKVPEVLLSGHHKNIEKWRLEQSVERTKQRRPDLYEKYMEEQKRLEELNPKKKKKVKKA